MFLATVNKLQEIEHKADMFHAKMENAMKWLNKQSQKSKDRQKGDVEGHYMYAVDLAVTAQKDMSWKKALKGNFDNAKGAYDKEMASLLKTILRLTEVFP